MVISEFNNIQSATSQSADISSRVVLFTFFSDLLAGEQAIGYFPFLESVENNEEIIAQMERCLFELQ